MKIIYSFLLLFFSLNICAMEWDFDYSEDKTCLIDSESTIEYLTDTNYNLETEKQLFASMHLQVVEDKDVGPEKVGLKTMHEFAILLNVKFDETIAKFKANQMHAINIKKDNILQASFFFCATELDNEPAIRIRHINMVDVKNVEAHLALKKIFYDSVLPIMREKISNANKVVILSHNGIKIFDDLINTIDFLHVDIVVEQDKQTYILALPESI